MDRNPLPWIPEEIQRMIWLLSIKDEIVSTDPATDGLEREGVTSTSTMSAVNFHTRSIVGPPVLPAILVNRSGGRYQLRLECDTIKTVDLEVPVDSAAISGEPRQSPIVKLLITSYSTFLPSDGNLSSGPDSFWDYHHSAALRLPRTPALPLNTMSYLGELTISCTRAHYQWYLETYNVQGPEMSGLPHAESLWHKPTLGRVNFYDSKLHRFRSTEGAKYYDTKGIETDTGIRWSVDKDEHPDGSLWDKRDPAVKWMNQFGPPRPNSSTPSPWDYRPRVGLRGFSMNAASVGGCWGGFRYFQPQDGLTTPRLDFSPLSWDDVKDVTFACQNSKNVGGHFPEMIVKVYIVKPGEDAPAGGEHCCWETVTWGVGPMPGISQPDAMMLRDDQIRIQAMWMMVVKRFGELRWDAQSHLIVLG